MPRINSKAQNLFLFLASLFLSLLLAEGALRLMAGRLGLKSQEAFYEYNPILGWDHVAGKMGIFQTDEYTTELGFNSRGVRGPECPYTKDSQTFRIVILGDSFAEGYSVSFENLFSELLRVKLNQNPGRRYEIVNLGIAGYSTDQEVLLFENEAQKYKPELTILLFYENDVWFNTQPDYWRGRKPSFQLKEGELALFDPAAPASWIKPKNNGSFRGMIKRFYLYNFLNKMLENSPQLYRLALKSGIKKFPDEFRVWKKISDPDFAQAWDLTEALLLRLKNSAEKVGSRFVVFYVPSELCIDSRAWEEAEFKYNISRDVWSPDTVGADLTAICRKNSIPLIDPKDDFLKQNKRLYFRRDGHWNADGHALVSDILYSYIKGPQ